MPFDPSAVPFVEITFWVMAVCAIGGAIGVVSSRKLFYSALYLILSFFGVTGFYVLLSAGFLAVIQLMVYVGAIAILILFAIMLSRGMMAGGSQANRQWWLSLPIALVLFGILSNVINSVAWPVSGEEPTTDMVQALGVAFVESYLIPFEVVSVLLSVALVGAIILAREKTKAEVEETY